MEINIKQNRIELVLKDEETLNIVADYGLLKVTDGYTNPSGPRTDIVSGPVLIRKDD